ncbi:MAG: PAS domain S-box protein [Alphaproteobacteria bacterium]|nr:PAS domain S-box protein [Alphaproteobacteria bacterium]
MSARQDQFSASGDADDTTARLQSVLETVPDAMVVIDERGLIDSFSRAAERMFGYAATEVVGRNVSMLMPAPYRDEHHRYIERYLRTGERRIIGVGRVVPAQRKDGTTFPVELSVGEVQFRGGRLFIGFIHDITQRRRTERRLDELMTELAHVSRVNEIGQMGSTLAHELNQPLTAILAYLGAAQQLLESNAGRDKVRSMIERAVNQAERAGAVIQKLREFLGKGRTVRHLESINKVVEEASALALIGAKQQGIRTRLELDPAAPMVAIDRVQIQQVLVNLIRNAVEAMSESATRELGIRTDAGDGVVTISVSDTGAGISSDVAAKLFEPFVSTKAQGMGIGLSICRSIVQSHGGDIQVRPGASDGGTTFFFTLPVDGPKP